jgi:hypothetical protein
MIEYIEVRGNDTNVIGIIDTATIIWHSIYFGVGDFEIHTKATPEIVSLLKAGRFVTRPDNDDVGIIEKLYIPENIDAGETITASGRFVKSILDRRLIYNLTGNSNKATILRGNVENAVREVVKNNAIACPFDSKRNFALLALGEAANIPLRIVDADGNAAEKQVSYENLLTYTDGVLEEYGLSSKCILRNGLFLYTVYSGTNRSIDNGENMPVIFSKEFDNLTSSEYTYDETTEKNVALIGGEGEGIERFYSLLAKSESDLQRREIFIDASSISKKYKDENDVEQTYTDAQYKTMLDAKGKQDIAPLVTTETFNGTLDVTNGNYIYGRDFALGDIVTVQNENIGIYINVRIREALEYQDENGYAVEVIYQ